MNRNKMLKVFRDAIEDLSEVIPLRHEVSDALYEEFNDALRDRDYKEMDADDIEYILGAT